MERFIRLDKKGTWKGVEHRSHFVAYEYEEDEKYLENGVSCYKASIEGIEDLYRYANVNMSLSYEDLKEMQLTVFEGEYSGTGSDGEEIALCKFTVKEIEAYNWYKSIEKAKEMADIDEDGEYYDSKKDDYFKGLNKEDYEKLILNVTGLIFKSIKK